MKTLVNNRHSERINGVINEANGIKVGDRVWCKHGEVTGTVTEITVWNPDYAFRVKLDKETTIFGHTYTETGYRRAAITKNFNQDGVIVGNVDYYSEQLKYGTGCIHEYELGGVSLRVESTHKGVYPGLDNGWGNEYLVTIRHKNGNDQTDTMTLNEAAQLLARLYTKEPVAA